MDTLSTLKTLSEIRHKRVDDAQLAMMIANRVLKEKKEALVTAKQAVTDYEVELPVLIETLYKDVLNQKIDVVILQEKVAEEVKLTHHLDVLKGQEKEAGQAVETAESELVGAQVHLQTQERKKDATDELVKKTQQKAKRDAERLLGKTIDELASMRYVLNK